MVTLDPRADAFFFWSSNEGFFTDVYEYSDDRVSFIFNANLGTQGRDVRLIIGVGDNLGQTDRVAVYLRGNDEVTAVISPFEAANHSFQTLPMATDSSVFEQGRNTNIAFAVGNINETITDILMDVVDLAPATSYFSVVSGDTAFSLADEKIAIENLERLQPTANPNLERAASTLIGGDRQNVIIAPVSQWDIDLVTQAQEIEARGFLVYLLVYEGEDENFNFLQMAHPNTILYRDFEDLQNQLEDLPLFNQPAPMARFLPFDAETNDTTFADVTAEHWAAYEITNLTRRGAIAGRGADIFAPDDQTTIAEFLAMTLRLAYGWTPGTDLNPYINYGIDQGFVTQATADDNITREHAFFILEQVFSGDQAIEGNRVRDGLALFSLPFNFLDIMDIETRNIPAISRLYQVDIARGFLDEPVYNSRVLLPTDEINRGEVASMLFRAIGLEKSNIRLLDVNLTHALPYGLQWQRFSHEESDTEMLITVDRIDYFLGHEDVLLGVTRFLGEPTGNLYVLTNGEWLLQGYIVMNEAGISPMQSRLLSASLLTPLLAGMVRHSMGQNRDDVENPFFQDQFGEFVWEAMLARGNAVASEEEAAIVGPLGSDLAGMYAVASITDEFLEEIAVLLEEMDRLQELYPEIWDFDKVPQGESSDIFVR